MGVESSGDSTATAVGAARAASSSSSPPLKKPTFQWDWQGPAPLSLSLCAPTKIQRNRLPSLSRASSAADRAFRLFNISRGKRNSPRLNIHSKKRDCHFQYVDSLSVACNECIRNQNIIF